MVCEKDTDIGKTRTELSSILPAAWIPSSYIKVDAIPLTPNGKINRHALKSLIDENAISEETDSAPTNRIESVLLNIWQTVMHRKTAIGIHQNVFEAGANSIIATQANYKIYRELFAKLKLKDLFENPTIAGQAALILISEENIYKKIERIPDAEYFEASHAQKRMWLLNQIPDSRITLTESLVISFKNTFDQEIFDRAANAVIARHEILRTSVFIEGDRVIQKVKTPGDYIFRSTRIDCREKNLDKDALQQLISDAIAVPFDLSKDVLFRFLIAETGEKDHKIIFTNHHIISDDWSKNILIKELFENYHQLLEGKTAEVQNLRIHYRDFASWQNNYLDSADGMAHKNYWTTKFKSPPPSINLAPEIEPPENVAVWAKEFEFSIEKELMTELIKLGGKISGTTFMVLMSGFKTLIYCMSGETDIVVGMPTAGRTHPDLENQIGFYLNLLPVRSFIDPHLSFETMTLQEKENLLAAHEHQFFPFDLLVNNLTYKSNPGKHPLFDVGITYHNLNYFFHETYNQIELLEVDEVTTATDLWFHIYNRPDSFYCKFIYRSALYSPSVIAELKEFFLHILKRVTESPEISPYELKQELGQIRNLRIQNNKSKRLGKLREKNNHI
ncbi:MAG: hypothetical protein IAF38_08445 [Bacteroidia bacterium]|nr:hypothetical protein [Bacteroidia bacterium]